MAKSHGSHKNIRNCSTFIDTIGANISMEIRGDSVKSKQEPGDGGQPAGASPRMNKGKTKAVQRIQWKPCKTKVPARCAAHPGNEDHRNGFGAEGLNPRAAANSVSVPGDKIARAA